MGRPPWKQRRRMMWAALLFCAVIIGYLAVAGADNELTRSIAWSLIGLSTIIITGYLGFATWDDRNVMQMMGRDAYRDEPPA